MVRIEKDLSALEHPPYDPLHYFESRSWIFWIHEFPGALLAICSKSVQFCEDASEDNHTERIKPQTK